ncbi:MAG: hypothetical protein ACKVS9_19755 [Phycisphaerae bacterium]
MVAKISIAVAAAALIVGMLMWRNAPQRLSAEEIETLRHDCIAMTEELPGFKKHGAFIVAHSPGCDELAVRDATTRSGGRVAFDPERFIQAYFDCLTAHAREAGKTDLVTQLADISSRAAERLAGP